MSKKARLFLVASVPLTLLGWISFASAAVPAPSVDLQDQVTSLWQLIVAGGVSMIFQGILSVLALALVIYHFKNVRPETVVPADFSENLISLLEKKEYEKAISVSKQQQNLISSISLTVLNRFMKLKNPTPLQVESIVQVEGKGHIEKIWQNLTYLGDIAVVAPLVGLLGTVLGMINAFHYFKSGSIHPAVLTQGLAKAMINTVFGLVTAVFCLVFYAYFRGKVSTITSRAEAVASEITQALSH